MTLSNLSPMSRALRALTALVTVWCLGCSSFEPLLASLLGEEGVGGMACASESAIRGPRPGRSAGAANDGRLAVNAVAALDTEAHRDFNCGCQSCIAMSLPALLVDAGPSVVPSVPASEPLTLVSIEREPLVPPPQRTLQRA
jgi:hypothetical protein